MLQNSYQYPVIVVIGKVITCQIVRTKLQKSRCSPSFAACFSTTMLTCSWY